MALELLNRPGIEAILPHRRPFLFLESAVVERGKSARARLADLTAAEFEPFASYLIDQKIIPVTVVVEMLAQTLGLAFASGEGETEEVGLFADFRHVGSTRRELFLGQDIDLNASVTRVSTVFGRRFVKGEVKASVGRKTVERGTIKFALADRSSLFPSS